MEDELLAGSVREAAGSVVPASETDHSSSKSFKFAMLDWCWYGRVVLVEDELLAGSVQETVGAVMPASETVFGGD